MLVPLRAVLPLVTFVVLLGLPPLQGHAQQPSQAPASSPVPSAMSISGVVSTQGDIVLGGALVSLLTGDGEVASYVSDGEGGFRFDAVAPGSYTLVVALDGFDTLTLPLTVAGVQPVEVKADLRIAAVSERVEVVANTTALVPSTGTLAGGDALTGKELEEITGGGGFQSALRLLASVIEVPGGVSIKGGRPSQASVQLGPGAFVDPATGLSQVSLPDDAIDSVTVLPNPYAVEYRPLLVGAGAHSHTPRWRPLEDTPQQPRPLVPHEARIAAQHHRHLGLLAARRDRRTADCRQAVPAAGGPVPLSYQRRAEPPPG